ncbi:MFS transporter [Massilia sp. TS11]|uniref:MFS transporter n=1 Tax=Massilia sp. TS11 TaxID=2908003 RepID=UPI001ED9E504|nr:MFS transporter [Massilia sp. TS11]MCG2585058.1 MFS transporter [Massilia sp. TS11]
MTKQARPLAYGLLALPLAFAALPVYVHVPPLYAAQGLSLATLGAVLFATRIGDVLLDPLLGALADRVPRARMAALALVPLAAGYVALFHPPAAGALAWLIGALLLCYGGLAAANIAYLSLAAPAQDAALLNRLAGAREGLGLIGVLLAAALPSVLAADLAQGLARMAWLLPVLLLLTAPLSLRAVAPAPPCAAPLWPGLRAVWGARALRRLLLVGLLNGVAGALPATLFLFFVADVLQAARWSGALLLAYFLAGALGLPLWLRLAARWGRVRAWRAAMLLAFCGFAGAAALGPGQVLAFAALCLLSGLALGADLALPASLVAGLGVRLGQPGACSGLWQCLVKLNLAVAAGLGLPLLALLGYTPGAGGGRLPLALAYGLLPVCLKAGAWWLLGRWRHELEEQA